MDHVNTLYHKAQWANIWGVRCLCLFKGFLQSQRPNFNLRMKPEEKKSAGGEERKGGGSIKKNKWLH